MPLSRVVKPSRVATEAFKRWRIVRGDKVQIIGGRKDVGKQGVVKRVNRERSTLVVTGLNMVRKHIKGTPEYRGTIVSMEAPIHVSKVQLVDPSTGLPTKVSVKFTAEGEKVRVARSSDTPIPRPDILKERRRPRREPGPKDTSPEQVLERTFFPRAASPAPADSAEAAV